MILIITFNLFLLFIVFLYLDEGSTRPAFVKAFVTILFLVAVSTELLSVFDSLRFTAVFIFWTFSFLALLWFSIRKGFGEEIRPLIKIMEKGLALSWIDWVGVGFISLILSLTLLIAILAPPNNFDSMTYHMARVAEWIQHENIRFYPTAIPRQNHAMPLAEYTILHLQLLSRSDQYANLVQWASFLVSIVVASLIAEELDVSRTGQIFASVLVATIPMAILQSSSTQNDLVVGALCLSFAYFLIRVTQKMSPMDAFFASLSVGLALLTKGTAYLYCAGIGLGIGVGALFTSKQTFKKKRLFGLLAGIVLGALIINTGHYVRNIDLYGYPLSPANSRITVGRISLGNTIVNLIRNMAIHLGIPFQSYNEGLTKEIHYILGKFASHPTSTFEGEEFKITFSINADYSGNLVHLIFLILSFPMIFGTQRSRNNIVFHYSAGIFMAVLLYNITIKWQPWASRLHTPLFLVGMPLVAFVIDRVRRSDIFPSILVAIMFLYSLPFLFLNETRPLIPFFEQESFLRTNSVKKFFSNRPKLYNQLSSALSPFYKGRSVLITERQKLYFMSQFDYYWDYVGAMKEVEKWDLDVVGLYLGSNDWEYPLWVLSGKQASRQEPQFIHVGVENETRELMTDPFLLPDLIIDTKRLPAGTGFWGKYRTIYQSDSVNVLVKK